MAVAFVKLVAAYARTIDIYEAEEIIEEARNDRDIERILAENEIFEGARARLKNIGTGNKKLRVWVSPRLNFIVVKENTGYELYKLDTWAIDVDVEDFYPDTEVRFNKDFWDHPSYLYHATDANNVPDIESDGLSPRSRTRGLTNRGTGPAIFTTLDKDDAREGVYGDVIYRIDTLEMRKKGYKPFVAQEAPYTEYELRYALFNILGIEFPEDLEHGISPDTVVVFGKIPPKFLTRVNQNGHIQADATSTRAQQRKAVHIYDRLIKYIRSEFDGNLPTYIHGYKLGTDIKKLTFRFEKQGRRSHFQNNSNGYHTITMGMHGRNWETSRLFKRKLIHEITHWLDLKRMKKGWSRAEQSYPTDPLLHMVQYVNHPIETNAYFQQALSTITHKIEKLLREIDPNNPNENDHAIAVWELDDWRKDYGGKFYQFRRKFWLAIATNVHKAMNAKTKRRFDTRLYVVWKDLQERADNLWDELLAKGDKMARLM